MRPAATEAGDGGGSLRRYAPMGAGIAAFVVAGAIYLAGAHDLYAWLLRAWGLKPWPWPFLDTDTILSALRCRRLGIDIFVSNPCDELNRLYDYSPLWLLGAALPMTTAWIVPVGLGFNALFFVALTLLPPGRTWRDTAIVALGVLSTATAYASERGNNDLVVFALGAFTASLACRSQGLRLLGYGCALVAGLLKYYPLALMAIAAREGFRRLLAIAAVSTAVVALFIVIERVELFRALALIPTGSYYTDMFGARTLPYGVAHLYTRLQGAAPLLEVALLLGAATIGVMGGMRPGFRDDLGRLTEPERMFLLAGSLLLLGCFVSAQNLGYRAIHIIMLLPGLTALARVRRRPVTIGASIVVALLLLWAEMWRHLIDHVWAVEGLAGADKASFGAWLFREACWWWLVTVLFGLAAGLLLRTESAQTVLAWFGRRTAGFAGSR